MSQEHADISYMKGDQVGKVVAMGLAELYRVKPQFPVDYLSKWLYNYSDQQREMKRIQEEKKTKAELLGDIHRQKLQREESHNRELMAAEQFKRRVNQFETEVAHAEYHDELIADFLPNEVMKLVQGLTSVYLGWFEMQRKPVDLDENDDELAHFDMNKPKLIQYIGGDEKIRVGSGQ
jgi:hypothetical protein